MKTVSFNLPPEILSVPAALQITPSSLWDLAKTLPSAANSFPLMTPPHDFYAHQTTPSPPVRDVKAAKTDLYATTGNPLSLEDVTRKFKELFPGEPFLVQGNFEQGLVVYSTNNDLHLIAVPSNRFIASAFHYLDNGRIVEVEFGGQARANHHNYSIIEKANPNTRDDLQRAVDYLKSPQETLLSTYQRDQELRRQGRHKELSLSGAMQVGFERECWVMDPKTGELAPIRDEELLVGCVEIDEGLYITPLHAAKGMAHQQKLLQERFGDLLIINTSAPPSGSPRQSEVNIYNEPHKKRNLGPYIAVVESYCFKRYKPYTAYSRRIREQQAKHHGYADADSMIREHGDCRSWSTAAAHTNLGVVNTYNPKTQRYEVDFELARNLSNIALSELGAIARMLMASSPYITEILPELDGQTPIDTREFIRQDMGTALPHNEPIRDAAHYRRIITQTMTAGEKGADRLARAVVAHTDASGKHLATAHGAGRWRFEDTGSPSGRLEYTGAGSTSILPKTRAMAVLQMLEAIAMVATTQDKDVFDYIKENYGLEFLEVWGDADTTVQEFMLMGPRSLRAQRLLTKLELLIHKTNLPALDEVKPVALAALKGLKQDANITQFAKGQGTLGGALLKLAQQGYTGLDVAKIVDSFLRQESDFISLADNETVTAYLTGRAGFNFVMPSGLSRQVA